MREKTETTIRKKCDFPCYSAFIPILSKAAFEALKPLIGNLCQSILVASDDENFVLLNVLNRQELIDLNNSEVVWMNNKVTDLRSPVYKKGNFEQQFIFRDSTDLRGPIYVNDAFVNIVNKFHLTGFEFTPINIAL